MVLKVGEKDVRNVGKKCSALSNLVELTQHPCKIFLPGPRDAGANVGTLSSGIPRPPVLPFVYNDTVETIQQLGASIIAEINSTAEHILASVGSPDAATFENTVLLWLQFENEFYDRSSPAGLYDAGTDQKLADAADELSQNITAALADVFTRDDFFQLVDHVYQFNTTTNGAALGEEDRIALAGVWRDFSKNGLNIPVGLERNAFHNMTDRIEAIEKEFYASFNNEVYAYFTADELEGLPAEDIQSLPKTTGEYAGKLNVSLFDYAEDILNYCVNETTRYTALLVTFNSNPKDVSLQHEIVELRLKIAQQFNYTSYADFTTSNNVAGSAKAVDDLITDLQVHVSPLGEDEQEALNALKAQDKNIVGAIGKSDISYMWDEDYYTKIQDKAADFDSDQYADYFPINITVPKILEFYGEIYGLRFDRIQGQDADELSPTGNGSDLVWYPDVQLYAVWNNQAFIDAYLDLFHRDVGNSGAGYMQSVRAGFIDADGCRHYPAAAAFGSSPKSDNEDEMPSLIADPTTILHELGHCMHHLSSRTSYVRNFGPDGVPVDFAEFPSQLMEHWGYQPEALKRISFHWSHFSPQGAAAWRKTQNDTTGTIPLPPATIPEDLVAKFVNHTANQAGGQALFQFYLTRYDQALYNITSLDVAAALDVDALSNQLMRSVTLVPDYSDVGLGYDWGHFEVRQTYTINEAYSANYYAYLWCKVYADDVFFTFFFGENLFNGEIGMKYRTTVLQPGAARPPLQSLEDFLGRAPSTDGYFRGLGLDPSAPSGS
ncbi:metallopeptidase MepB like protein [Zymoseptoria brevis]|uniref:Metallopeptidase MepB like protein n=1 Tax=Zymoseptoria brevis TaxID=1047168 RepID=A0A0F4GXF7_9PEZI|nr:metallopeptidase MepB like protein [Zymoseptoria brevis]